jgi:hypothetical protein
VKQLLFAAGLALVMIATAAAPAESFTALGEQALGEMGAEVVECANARTESVCGAVPGDFSVVEAAFEESETLAALEPQDEWHDDHGMMMRRYTWADAPDGEQEILVIFNANNPAMNLQMVTVN